MASKSQRAKGTDVTISILLDGVLQTRIDSVKSCEVEFMIDTLEEDYLGEDSSRYDHVYKGWSVDALMHCNSSDYLALLDASVGSARRRNGAVIQVNMLVTCAFPNGDLQTLILQDLKFGNLPFKAGGRKEFVEASLTAQGSQYKII